MSDMPSKTKVPQLSAFAEFAAANERLAKLRQELRDYKLERDSVAARFAEARKGATVTAKAKALLFGGEAMDRETLDGRLGELDEAIVVHEYAVSLARAEREKGRSSASRKLCEEVRPEHRKLAMRVIAAARELAHACQAEAQFRGQLEGAGVLVTLPVVQVGGLGRLDAEYGSRILNFLSDCYAWGFVTLNELPDVLKRQLQPRKAPPPMQRKDTARAPVPAARHDGAAVLIPS